MSCCGKARPRSPTATRTPYPSSRAAAPVTATPVGATTSGRDPQGTLFEYVGPTRMMVRGPASGRIYRFSKSHTRVLIEDRDAPFLAAVPNLRPAAAPG
jgi:hypothetical protein